MSIIIVEWQHPSFQFLQFSIWRLYTPVAIGSLQECARRDSKILSRSITFWCDFFCQQETFRENIGNFPGFHAFKFSHVSK
jgi:hypothetical protein